MKDFYIRKKPFEIKNGKLKKIFVGCGLKLKIH
jgi:hypothetical protein